MTNMEITMTTDEMEMFFKKTLFDISSRPKRTGKRLSRNIQRNKIITIEKSVEENNFSRISNFFSMICSIGCSNEGTPL